MEPLYDVIYEGRVIGLATGKIRAQQIIEAHTKNCKVVNVKTHPVEAASFLGLLLNKALKDDDNATFTDCLFRLRELHQEISNPNNSTKGENKQ